MAMGKQILKVLARRFFYILWFLFDPSKFVKINPRKVKRILVVNLGFIGDLLATTPMIAAMKKKFKGELSVLVREEMKGLLAGNEILVYKDDFQKDLQQIKNKFDLAVIVWPASFKISSLCKKAGIPYRIGTTQTGLLEEKGYFLTRMVKPSCKEKHKVQENLDISRLVGANLANPRMEFYFSKKDGLFINKFLRGKKRIIVIHPGKRGKFYVEYSWPLDKFARVADYLAEKHKASIVITGAKGEEKIAQAIANKMKSKPLIATGKLTLSQFGALLKKAKLLVSIDTAAVHIASAFETKVIVINPKYPKIWHPYMSRKRYKLLKHPNVSDVIKASKELK